MNKAFQQADAMASGSAPDPPNAEDLRRRIAHLIAWLEKDGYSLVRSRLVPASDAPSSSINAITEVSRRNIQEFISQSGVNWWGRLTPADFLARLYDLEGMPSLDGRFRSADGDIRQHTECNDDWGPSWVFADSRFDLLRCPDEAFLRFLAEMLHPVVLASEEDQDILLKTFNGELGVDGWNLNEVSRMSGRPVFAGNRIGEGVSTAIERAKAVAKTLSADDVARQITRMDDALKDDTELAIGTAKEFIETICKTILTECGKTVARTDDIPRLVKLAAKQLKLTPDDVPDAAKGAKRIRVLLSNLATVAQGLAELRGLYGTGHGKPANTGGLTTRHAKLAVGAATTLGVFLFETFEERKRHT